MPTAVITVVCLAGMSGSSDCITAHHYSEVAVSEYTNEPTALADEQEGADHHSSEHRQQDHQGVEEELEYAPAEHEEHSEIRAETEEVILP